MAKPFTGVWGTFEHLDEASAVVRAMREQGREYSVMSPFYHHELHHAMGNPASRVPFVTLCFGAMGIFFGYALPSWTALDWVLPVSSKPIVSLPPFTIFGFELMVLLGGTSTACAILVLGQMALARKPLPRSAKFKGYAGFSRDRFGVVVRCEQGEAAQIEQLMRKHSAEEVVREF